MNLSPTGDQNFLRFRIPIKFQSDILVEYFRYGGDDFVLFSFFLRFQGKGDQGGQGIREFELHLIPLMAQGVSGVCILQLGHCDNGTRPCTCNRFLLFSRYSQQLGKPFLGASIDIIESAIGSEGSGYDTQNRELAGIRIGYGFKNKG